MKISTYKQVSVDFCGDILFIVADLNNDRLFCMPCSANLHSEPEIYFKSTDLTKMLEYYYLDNYNLEDKFKMYHGSKCKIKKNNFKGLGILTMTQCNYNCPKCSRILKNKEDYKDLEIQLTLEVFKFVKKYGIRTIHLGGQCELSCYDIEIFNYIPKCVNNIYLLSNASDYSFLHNFIELCKDRNINLKIQCSLPSIDENLYDKITGTKGNLPIVLGNLQKLKEEVDLQIDIVCFNEYSKNFKETFEFVKNNFKEYKITRDIFDSRKNSFVNNLNAVLNGQTIYDADEGSFVIVGN